MEAMDRVARTRIVFITRAEALKFVPNCVSHNPITALSLHNDSATDVELDFSRSIALPCVSFSKANFLFS